MTTYFQLNVLHKRQGINPTPATAKAEKDVNEALNALDQIWLTKEKQWIANHDGVSIADLFAYEETAQVKLIILNTTQHIATQQHNTNNTMQHNTIQRSTTQHSQATKS